MSQLVRVHNSGSLFLSNLCNLFLLKIFTAVRIIGVSVIHCSRVSARRELTVFKKQFTVTVVRDLRKVISNKQHP